MKNYYTWFVIFSVLISAHTTAQEKWTLEKCISYAHENNIQVKQQELNVQYFSNDLFQSRLSQLPNLNADVGYNLSMGRALDPTTYEFTQNETVQNANFNIRSSVVLFNGLQKKNTIEQKRIDLESKQYDLNKLKNDIAVNVAYAYLNILFNTELVDVAKGQLEITSQQVERTSKLVEAGSLARGSLLEIQAQAAQEELNLVNAQNNLDISYLNLTQLLELDSTGGFEIFIPEFDDFSNDMLSESVSYIFSMAVQNLPEIRSAELQLKSAEKGLNIAEGARSPRLSASISYGSLYSDKQERFKFDENGNVIATEAYPFADQLSDNASTTVGLGLSIPIFNGWQVNTGISNARINIENYKYQLENEKNVLYKDIQQKYADAIAALKRYDASGKSVNSLEESFRYTEEKYNVGMVNSVDYNLSKNQLTAAQSELLQAKYDFIFKTKLLEFYTGIPIKL